MSGYTDGPEAATQATYLVLQLARSPENLESLLQAESLLGLLSRLLLEEESEFVLPGQCIGKADFFRIVTCPPQLTIETLQMLVGKHGLFSVGRCSPAL